MLEQKNVRENSRRPARQVIRYVLQLRRLLHLNWPRILISFVILFSTTSPDDRHIVRPPPTLLFAPVSSLSPTLPTRFLPSFPLPLATMSDANSHDSAKPQDSAEEAGVEVLEHGTGNEDEEESEDEEDLWIKTEKDGMSTPSS